MHTDPPILVPRSAPADSDLLEVESLADDGTVNLWWGTQRIVGVPAATSYTRRKAGDIVKVTKSPTWRVEGPVGPPVDDTVTWAQIKGKPQLVDAATGDALTSPDPVDLTPTDRVGYQGGHKTGWNRGRPAQGSYGGNPANTGIWFYGSKITDAVGSKTPVSGTVHLSRRNTGGNLNRAVPVHLFLVDPGSPPYRTPSLSDGWTPSGGLRGNAAHDFPIPGDRLAKLASGAKRGIAASAGRGEDYILFAVCGGVHIEFG